MEGRRGEEEGVKSHIQVALHGCSNDERLRKKMCRRRCEYSLVQLQSLYELQARPSEELLIPVEGHGMTSEVPQVVVQAEFLEHFSHWGSRIDTCAVRGRGDSDRRESRARATNYVPWCVLGLPSS